MLNKIENIKKAPRYLYDDYISDYNTLLKRAENFTIELKRLSMLALGILKIITQINPSSVKEFFNMRKGTDKREKGLTIPARKSMTYGDKN